MIYVMDNLNSVFMNQVIFLLLGSCGVLSDFNHNYNFFQFFVKWCRVIEFPGVFKINKICFILFLCFFFIDLSHKNR